MITDDTQNTNTAPEVKETETLDEVSELLKCTLERDEYLAGWQRAKADFVNFKKASDQARLAILDDAVKIVIRDILPIADGFDQALFLTKPDAETNGDSLKIGISNLQKALNAFFEKYEISTFGTVGDKFDPLLHNAVSLIDSETKDDTIAEIHKRGYQCKNGILRPAYVSVYNKKDN